MWVAVSLFSSFLDSVKYVLGKKGTYYTDASVVGWSQWFFGLFLFLPFLFFIKISPPDSGFWIVLLLSGILNSVAIILFWKGMELTDISIATPLVNFTPFFALLLFSLFSKELPTFFGFLGVFIIVIGAYVLGLNRQHQGIFMPLLSLLKEKGSRVILLVSLLWGITTFLDKQAIDLSSPIVYLISLYIIISILLFPFLFTKRKKRVSNSTFLRLIPLGIIAGAAHLTQMYAFTLMYVPYVASLKSTTAIFSSIFGFFLFKEKHIKHRLLGACVMCIGVGMILFYG